MGPISDVKSHYLHARAHEVSELLAQPPAWRTNSELTRARQALELREMINDHFCASSDTPLPTRGLRAMIDYLDGPEQVSQAVS